MEEGTILGHTDGKQYVVRDGAWAYHGETPATDFVDLGKVQGGVAADQGSYGAIDIGTIDAVAVEASPSIPADL